MSINSLKNNSLYKQYYKFTFVTNYKHKIKCLVEIKDSIEERFILEIYYYFNYKFLKQVQLSTELK